ncbi:hypothetical protein GGR20_001477 [Devosia subaequoris]|uniref:HTH HARE-type domain-containing protein n=1 Tax=Devosia subaequoris TaxID=395930 RepID=A0A7W6IMT8_9HYPH|nr:HTH domain-containing protein [Devosia subaequoris]MBB4051835.1 hypothetical protein [Devosia subaequoris]MCP1210992.1 HTH domain-containing protein [Devosia subaequoris]
MSSYLDIAQAILDLEKKPMSARQIMRRAFEFRLVPSGLYGRTQHKTLQARLSEDILLRKDRSDFFRTKPGQFFLRKYITDATLPVSYRTPIAARRRVRELVNGRVLTFRRSDVDELLGQSDTSTAKEFLGSSIGQKFLYRHFSTIPEDEVAVWSLAVMMRDQSVLGYRIGRYRDGRDDFQLKRTFVFSSAVTEEDLNLFNFNDLGIVDSAVTAIATDLDIPVGQDDNLNNVFEAQLDTVLYDHGRHSALIMLVKIDCPEWFEPTSRRLSLNNLHWIDLSQKINNVADFDPWSQRILHTLQSTY